MNLYTKFEVSVLNSCGDILDEKSGEKEKNKQTSGRTNRRRPIFSPTIQFVVVNLYTKFEVSILNGCGDVFDKKLERKKKEQIKGRTNRRRPICNPTIKLVVVNLYTKYKVSIFNGSGNIFDEKFGKKEKGTNKRRNK